MCKKMEKQAEEHTKKRQEKMQTDLQKMVDMFNELREGAFTEQCIKSDCYATAAAGDFGKGLSKQVLSKVELVDGKMVHTDK